MFVVTNLLVLDYLLELWLGGIAVRVLDLQSAGCTGLTSGITLLGATLGELFTHVGLCHQAV